MKGKLDSLQTQLNYSQRTLEEVQADRSLLAEKYRQTKSLDSV
jgi:predicted S18 family serine protease